MNKSIKNDYLHILNRVENLQKKKNEISKKEKSYNDRIKRLIVSWIKRNHKDWLENIPPNNTELIQIASKENNNITIEIWESKDFATKPKPIAASNLKNWQLVKHNITVDEL